VRVSLLLSLSPELWTGPLFAKARRVLYPDVLPEMLMDPDSERSQRVTKAFLQMKKFDIEELKRVYEGQNPWGDHDEISAGGVTAGVEGRS
jgi:hypothetical protein